MKQPFINIKLTLSRRDGKLSIRMKGSNFTESTELGDLPPDQQVLWDTALAMLEVASAAPNQAP